MSSCEEDRRAGNSPAFMNGSGEVGQQKDKTEDEEDDVEVESGAEIDEVSSADVVVESAEERGLVGEEGVSGQDSGEDSETQSDAGVLEVPEETEDCWSIVESEEQEEVSEHEC